MTIEAFAKVNFTLEVLGERADGFHALRSLVVPVSLSDTLEIAPADAFSSDTGYADDLCLKAARTLYDALGRDGGDAGRGGPAGAARRPCAIRVVKRIPAGGGLGGGSADAAATLVALNRMWGAGLSDDALAKLGADVGSDVPALVLAQSGVPVVMEGRGEIVRPVRDAARRLDMVLVNPGVFSSTAEVFSKCKFRVTNDVSILYNILQALRVGDVDGISAAMMNDLEPCAVALHPEIAVAKQALLEAGAVGATMSGSGSTVFGLVRSEDDGHRIASSLVAKGYSAWSAVACCPVV